MITEASLQPFSLWRAFPPPRANTLHVPLPSPQPRLSLSLSVCFLSRALVLQMIFTSEFLPEGLEGGREVVARF